MVTWLIVEDEHDLHDILLSVFELWGVEGVPFEDGAETMRWLDRVDLGLVTRYPQLAFLDIWLPNVSGFEISARIRQSPYLRHMAIVLMTAYRLTPEQEAEALALSGADKLIYKPLPAMRDLRIILETTVSRVNQRHNPAGNPSTALKAGREDDFLV